MVDAQRRLFLRGKGSKAAASPARPPWSLREGDGGFPVIDFSAAGCSLCGDCSRACASGADSIGEAANIIRRGDADVAVAGGTEAAITPIAIAGFAAAR